MFGTVNFRGRRCGGRNVKRQALLSVGLLVTGIAVSMVGCGDDGGSGDPDNAAGDAGEAGKNAGAGTTNNGGKGGTESNGGTTSNGGNSAAGKGGFGGSGGVQVPGGGEGGVTQGGAGGTPDGGTPGDAGAGGAVGAGGAFGGAGGIGDGCSVKSAYGNLGALDGEATAYSDGSMDFQATIPAPAPYNGVLWIEFYPLAPFQNGFAPLNNHVLAGPDLNYKTCGLCLRLITEDEDQNKQFYFVTGGTVSLTGVDDGIIGSAVNLTFEEVTHDKGDGWKSTPVRGGCESSVSAMSFNDDFAQGGAGGSG